MDKVAIIPARGGSKRIPRKNIRDFLGKPILAYSIEVALESNLFSEVMVSTDDDEIKEVAIKYGAKVPFMRSIDSANDFATLADVIDEVKRNYSEHRKDFTYGCCILPTSPLLSELRLLEGFNLLVNRGFDSVRPVVEFSYPVQRALKLLDEKVEMIYPEYYRTRSQDLEKAYHDGGQFYWFKYSSGLIGRNKGAIVLNDGEVQDIDTLEDWKMAEQKYRILNS